MAGVIRLYTDLVSLNEDLRVKRETLATAQRLAEDNANKVDQGTLAPVELTRAQAQVAAARQDLVNSEGFVRQQELILKSVLVRDLSSDSLVHDARIIPTDPVSVAPCRRNPLTNWCASRCSFGRTTSQPPNSWKIHAFRSKARATR